MRLSASISFMFRELPLLERFAAARAAGFAGVEIQRLRDGNPQAMATAAREAGIEVALLNVPSGDFTDGGDGLSGVPGREETFEEAFAEALAAAVTLGARQLHIGPSRVPEGASREACLASLHRNVRLALSVSRGAGVTLLLEAMNRVDSPTALLDGVDAAAEVIQSIGHPRLALQFDLYHVAMNGEAPLESWRRHRSIVRHVQFSDVPGRHEPGTGTLDILGTLEAIDHGGYRGWFGAEYFPSARTNESLAWMRMLGARSVA